MIITFSPLLLIYILFLVLTDNFHKYISVLIIALLHEAGHLLVARFLGYGTSGIKIQVFGLNLKINQSDILPYHEIWICIAGPIVNIILIFFGVIALKFGCNLGNTFFISNFYMLFVNLLPMYPLDGGRIIKAVLFSDFKNKTAEKIFKIISLFSGFIILLCGILFFLRSKHNISLLIISLFLLDNVKIGNSKHSNIANMICSNIDKGIARVYYVNMNDSVKNVFSFVPCDDLNLIFVIDTDGMIVDKLTNKYIVKLMSEGLGNVKMSDISNHNQLSNLI